jgi:hypothetical protein
VRFENGEVINRPPDQVWAFLTDLFNSPRLRPGVLAVRQTHPACQRPQAKPDRRAHSGGLSFSREA